VFLFWNEAAIRASPLANLRRRSRNLLLEEISRRYQLEFLQTAHRVGQLAKIASGNWLRFETRFHFFSTSNGISLPPFPFQIHFSSRQARSTPSPTHIGIDGLSTISWFARSWKPAPLT